MAEGLTDEALQELVDDYKKRQKESSGDALHKLREGKVYANRSLSMDRIKYVGFDMDYTLVVYKSPAYEGLAFSLAVQRLISIGYPQEIHKLEYDSTFPIRGLLFDQLYGNLLKVDQFGNILSCFHGFNSLSTREIRQLYPNKYIQPTDDRIYILNTLFHLPEIYLLAALVDFFDQHTAYKRIEQGVEWFQGVKCGDVLISYHMIWQDVRSAIDWAHNEGGLKEKTLKNLDKYVQKNPALPPFLDKLRKSGRKLFIATNSGYSYTQQIMTYMFDYPHGPEPGTLHREWKTYFDYIIVDAQKPLFFAGGTMLREVDEDSCSLKLGVFTGALQPGKVYNGGSSAAFCKYTGVKGKEILYVGDHIFGDVIKAKKEQAWRTFLVLPELSDEVGVWKSNMPLFTRLQNLEYILTDIYTNTDGGEHVPDIDSLRKAIKAIAQDMEISYPSQLGSLLRCGSRQTHFAIQATRFADLYSSSCVNLANYPLSYLFSAPHQLMAHEDTPVAGLDIDTTLSPALTDKLSAKKRIMKGKLARGLSIIDHDMDEENGVVV